MVGEPLPGPVVGIQLFHVQAIGLADADVLVVLLHFSAGDIAVDIADKDLFYKPISGPGTEIEGDLDVRPCRRFQIEGQYPCRPAVLIQLYGSVTLDRRRG